MEFLKNQRCFLYSDLAGIDQQTLAGGRRWCDSSPSGTRRVPSTSWCICRHCPVGSLLPTAVAEPLAFLSKQALNLHTVLPRWCKRRGLLSSLGEKHSKWKYSPHFFSSHHLQPFIKLWPKEQSCQTKLRRMMELSAPLPTPMQDSLLMVCGKEQSSCWQCHM